MSVTTNMTLVLFAALNECAGEPNSLTWRRHVDDMAMIRLKTALLAIKRFCSNPDLGDLWIVCPTDDHGEIDRLAKSCLAGRSYRLIADEFVLASWGVERVDLIACCPGWYLQQILKLALGHLVKTTFYCIIDCDVIFRRHVDSCALVQAGRSVTNVEYDTDYQDLYKLEFARQELAIKRLRYATSMRLLSDGQRVSGRSHFYGETPVVVHTASICDTVAQIQRVNGSDWIAVLSRARNWSEYSLYFQYLELQGRIQQTCLLGGRQCILDLDRSVWQPSCEYRSLRSYGIEELFDERRGGVAIAIQSWVKPQDWLPKTYPTLHHFYQHVVEHIQFH